MCRRQENTAPTQHVLCKWKIYYRNLDVYHTTTLSRCQPGFMTQPRRSENFLPFSFCSRDSMLNMRDMKYLAKGQISGNTPVLFLPPSRGNLQISQSQRCSLVGTRLLLSGSEPPLLNRTWEGKPAPAVGSPGRAAAGGGPAGGRGTPLGVRCYRRRCR